MRTLILTMLVASAGSGCDFFDETLYMNAGDGGRPDSTTPDTGDRTDAPMTTQMAVDTCGAADTFVIGDTTVDIEIDTTVLAPRMTPNCAGHAARGNDGFFALEVSAGEYWHFHLRPDPTDPTFSERDPALYLINESCDDRMCSAAADSCSGSADEHFAFTAPSTGRWFIGVDDRNAGGGRYLLDAIRPVCGDNGNEHGESCDDGNLADGDGCDRLCRFELSDTARDERLPNDTPVEANVLRMPASNELTITGDIGGDNCYPDYFAVTVTEGARLEVTIVDSAGLPCTDGSTAPFDFTLLTASLGEAGGGRDLNDCPQIIEDGLSAGEYLIRIDGFEGEDRPTLYRMSVRIVP